MLQGLLYLHENKIIHGDLKCANVLVDHTDIDNVPVVKLSDFGCSKAFEKSHSGSLFSGSIRGSIFWMAPELLRGQPYSRKSDVWSLGCTLIEMAVGGEPWSEEFDAS